MGDARIHWSLRIGRRIRERLADDQAVPLGGWVLRWVHSRLGEDLYLLDEACDDQAFASAGRVGLVPSSADVTEAGVALEAWDLFTERWVSPAWGRQLSPKRLMTGYLAYLAALEAGGLVQRTEAREPGVDCLPGEVQEIDDRVSKGVADWFVDLPLPDLDWTAYADRVTAPLQRQQAGSLVAACSAATGRVVPASVAAVVELFENDWQDTVASLLGNPSVGQDAWKFAAGDDRAEDPRRTALPEHVRSLVVSSLVEQGAAVREHDWLMGSLLRSPQGTMLHIDAEIARLVEHGDGGALRTVLSVAGLRADVPVWLGADDAALHAWPDLVIPAIRPGRLRYLVVGPTDLRVVRDRSLAWGPGRRPAARARRILETPLHELDDAFEVVATIPFAEVATARLVSRRSGAGWRCRFDTKDGVVSTGGTGSGSAMARLLRSRLGDRVSVVGNVDNDLADPGATYGLVRLDGPGPRHPLPARRWTGHGGVRRRARSTRRSSPPAPCNGTTTDARRTTRAPARSWSTATPRPPPSPCAVPWSRAPSSWCVPPGCRSRAPSSWNPGRPATCCASSAFSAPCWSWSPGPSAYVAGCAGGRSPSRTARSTRPG